VTKHSSIEGPRRVALYAHYSTDMQNPMSIDDQFREAERHARRLGWIVVARFSDSGISGSIGRARPGFVELSEALSSRSFDIVLAESLDRISRDQEHLAGFYKAARFAGVEIHTIGRGKVDAMTLGLSSMMSAMFLEELSSKVRRGVEGKVLQGLSGGAASMGTGPVWTPAAWPSKARSSSTTSRRLSCAASSATMPPASRRSRSRRA
jgi:DNA invertase Pin-like site-specific DNA recombinase